MNLPALADLFASRGLRLLPGSYAVPVELLVQLPDATIVRFTARGTTLRLRSYSPDALTTITIPAECGCGDHHPQIGPSRMTLRRYAVPLAERVIDGELEYGWHHHEAGLLRLPEATEHFFTLLTQLAQLAHPPQLPQPPWSPQPPQPPWSPQPPQLPTRELAGVA